MSRFHCSFQSYSLGRLVSVTVLVPPAMSLEDRMALRGGEGKPTHQYKEKFPASYLFHGGGGDESDWLDNTMARLFCEEENMAIVIPSAEDKRFGVDDERYFDFIAYELRDFVSANFPISADPKDSFIAGLSMGGGAACYHFLKNPDHYAALGIFCSGIIRYNIGCEAMVAELAAQGKKVPPIYMICGEHDHNWYDIQKFKEILLDSGITTQLDWFPYQNFNHEWRIWNIAIEQFIKWVPRTDFYKGKSNRPSVSKENFGV